MRDTIIREIQRLAAINNGKPPGWRAFELETGIAQREWIGKIWARWGDAVKESGLQPNSLTLKLSSDDVLRQFAQATLDLGRLPSQQDLRLYARSHPGFPSTTTFENHFTNRGGLIEALWIWLEKNTEFQRINGLLPTRSPSAIGSYTRKKVDGFVYLLKSGAHYKIGRSDEIERRVKKISVSLPEASNLEHSIQTDDPPGIEAYWHRRFADKRANGEWFRLTRADISAFKRRKFQ